MSLNKTRDTDALPDREYSSLLSSLLLFSYPAIMNADLVHFFWEGVWWAQRDGVGAVDDGDENEPTQCFCSLFSTKRDTSKDIEQTHIHTPPDDTRIRDYEVKTRGACPGKDSK